MGVKTKLFLDVGEMEELRLMTIKAPLLWKKIVLGEDKKGFSVEDEDILVLYELLKVGKPKVLDSEAYGSLKNKFEQLYLMIVQN